MGVQMAQAVGATSVFVHVMRKERPTSGNEGTSF